MEEYVPHFKFEKLQIWQKAMDYALNIAEGSISQSNPEYKKFLGYAIRSLAEVVTCLHKAERRKYIDKEQFTKLYAEAFHLMNMMQSFKSKIN